MKEINKYIGERYKPQIKWYDNKSLLFKRISFTLQILIIVLASTVPVMAALEFKWLTIVGSAIVAILTGILKFGKFEELWHIYRTICETLKKEKYLLDYKVGEYATASEPSKLFIERVESLVSRENTDWFYLMKRKEEKKR